MSFPRYAEYKDSGVGWLGAVPGHWALKKIKHVASFSGGGTPSRENLAYWNGDIPWVSPKDMKAEKISAAEECITVEGLKSSAAKLVPAGMCLMVVRSGILKHTIPVAINELEVALNQDMKALAFLPEECQNRFFLRLVQGLNSDLLVAWAKQGATVESVEHEYLANTIIPIPTLPEQTAIATFLDREIGKIDALVAEQEKLIGLLKEKRQAVISHAVTKGLNPAAPMKDSGVEWLGEVPEHWTVVSLKHLVSYPIIDGPHETPTKYDEGVPFVSAESVSKGFINFDKIWGYISPEAHEQYSRRYKPKRGDIFIVKLGATTGTSALVETDDDFNIWVPLAAIRLKTEIIPKFILHVLRSDNLKMAYELNWTYGTQQTLGLQTISNLQISLPPDVEQREIVIYLDAVLPPIESLIVEAERAIALLKEYRSALISAAVTGKIDVRGLVDAEEAA